MNNDLPSIEDLLKKTPANSNGDSGNSDDKKNNNQQISTKEPDSPAAGKTKEEMTPEERLAEKMKNINLKSKEEEIKEIANLAGFPYINLQGFAISAEALTLIPEDQARKFKVVAFLHTGPELRIGAVNPADEKVSDIAFQLSERLKTNTVIYQISEESLKKALEFYKTIPKARVIIKGVQIKEDVLAKYQDKMNNFSDIQQIIQSANITDILAILIAAALKMKSSDIHIEAEETAVVTRLRIDGILQEVAKIDKSQWKKIINRIKLIAGLKLNINDKPQDGRFTIFQKNKKIDVRTSTLPTAWGESVVMRILNPESIQLEFEQLGFRPAALQKLQSEISKPHGMILTTGPTGSGKTTTLYAILRKLNKPGVNIITLEDPIEYKLEGINQSQINHSQEYTFAKGLRSILRQDPDIIMVGEIRDLETAETAIQAALTGHLLLSTIHTNDAAGAIPRFISMGVKPFLLAPALNAVMGQRLLRRLCEKCKTPAQLPEDKLQAVKSIINSIPANSGETIPNTDNIKFYSPVGCPECNNTGYKGRVGIYEILTKNKDVEELILSGEISEYKIRQIAAKSGMVTMQQDALLKAMEGITSIEEIERVVGLQPPETLTNQTNNQTPAVNIPNQTPPKTTPTNNTQQTEPPTESSK
ncbi:type II/IV secretion system protein [Candidatus Parcubacteria bacterium]|nr:MAG: type II/IV secretion system protein [Candidatus Parcubacteria bacterium]